jgi:hypothetical protein
MKMIPRLQRQRDAEISMLLLASLSPCTKASIRIQSNISHQQELIQLIDWKPTFS